MRIEKNNINNPRLLLLLPRLFALSSTIFMPRLSIDATGARGAVRAEGVPCGVRVSPQSPYYDYLFADRLSLQQNRKHTEHHLHHDAVVDKTPCLLCIIEKIFSLTISSMRV